MNFQTENGHEFSDGKMRYVLRQLQGTPGWWALDIPEEGICIRFRECGFNDTQEVRFSDPGAAERLGAAGLARVMQEAAEWLYLHAYEIAMPERPKYMFQLGAQDGRVMVIRTKRPRLAVHLMDECSAVQLGDALIHAGYFVKRNAERFREFSDASREERESPQEGDGD